MTNFLDKEFFFSMIVQKPQVWPEWPPVWGQRGSSLWFREWRRRRSLWSVWAAEGEEELASCRIWTCRCFQALFATTRESPKLRVRVPVWRWATQSSSYMKLWEAPGTTRAKSSPNRSSSCRLAGSTLIITSRSNSQSLCSRSGEESFKGNISCWLSSHGSELNKWNGKNVFLFSLGQRWRTVNMKMWSRWSMTSIRCSKMQNATTCLTQASTSGPSGCSRSCR